MKPFEERRDEASKKYTDEQSGDCDYCEMNEDFYRAGADWAYAEGKKESENLEEDVRFYRNEWELACERYNYANEERDTLTQQLADAQKEITGLKEINSIQKTYLKAAEQNEKNAQREIERLTALAESRRKEFDWYKASIGQQMVDAFSAKSKAVLGMREALESACTHYESDDPWYSCPMAENGMSDRDRGYVGGSDKKECNCGADKRIEALANFDALVKGGGK